MKFRVWWVASGWNLMASYLWLTQVCAVPKIDRFSGPAGKNVSNLLPSEHLALLGSNESNVVFQ
jgi:hypothetical protein